MRGIYKSRKNVVKNQFINGVYNLQKLSDDRIVVIINNTISARVTNECDIKKIIRMYFKPIYDTDTSEIEKSNDTLSIEKYKILVKNVYKS